MNRKNETLHDRFRKTAALLRRNRMREFGNFPDTQNRVLSLLTLNDGMNQRQLAYLLGIRPQSAGELLGKLESAGLIRRQSDENDGRVNLVYLTDEGRRITEMLAEKVEQEDIFDCLSDEEKAQLETLLGKIVDSHPLSEEELRRGRHPHHGKRRMGRMSQRFFEIIKEDMENRGMPFEGERDELDVRPMPYHKRMAALLNELEEDEPEEEVSEI